MHRSRAPLLTGAISPGAASAAGDAVAQKRNIRSLRHRRIPRVIVGNERLAGPSNSNSTPSKTSPDQQFDRMICIRPSSNVDNLPFLGSPIARHGKQNAKDRGRSVVANRARPQGGDADQTEGVASGACALRGGNHPDHVRLARSDHLAERLASDGTHGTRVWRQA